MNPRWILTLAALLNVSWVAEGYGAGPNAERDPLIFKPELTQIFALAFSPDGKLLTTTGFRRPVRVWDTATAKELVVLDPQAQCAVFSPDGHTLAVSGVHGRHDQEGWYVKLWSVSAINK